MNHNIKKSSLAGVINLLLVLIAFVFPFYTLISSYLIVVLLLVVVVSLLTKKIQLQQPELYFYIFISLYLINIVGLIYTNNFSIGLKTLETKASLIILPFIFLALKEIKLKTERILKAFVSGVFMATIICLLNAVWRQYQFNQFDKINWFFFSYRDFTEVLDIHPIYLAFYVSFSGVIILLYAARFYQYNRKPQLVWSIALYIYFFIMLFLLSSRINIAGHLILAFLLLILIGVKTKKWKLLATWGLVIIALIFIILNTFKVSKERIYEALNLNQQTEYIQKWGGNAINSVDVRFIKWNAAMDVIKNNWFFGVGTGDAQQELTKSYGNYNFSEGISRRFNVHNEFLQHTLTFGIMGLVLLLLNVFYPIYRSIKDTNFLYASFIFLFFFFALTESVMEVQKGIVAFSFFNSLFFFRDNSNITFQIK